MSYGVNAPQGLKPISNITGGTWVEKSNGYTIPAAYDTSIYVGDPVVFSGSLAAYKTINRYNPDFTNAAPSTFSTASILGSFLGCRYFDRTGKLIPTTAWIAGTPIYPNTEITCLVSDDPTIVYDIQVSTSIDAAGAFVGLPNFPNVTPAGDLRGGFGSNFALNIGGGTNFNTIPPEVVGLLPYNNNPATGDDVSGQSAFYLDVATPEGGEQTHDYNKTVVTLPLKPLKFSPDNILPPIVGATLANKPFMNVWATLNNHTFGHNTLGVPVVA